MTAKILLAEDNQNLAQMLARFLVAEGHTPTTVHNGTDALRLLASEQFDLLLLDLRLPEISGVELLQKLRKSPRLQGLPVIIMTGVFKGEKYVQAASRLGVKHYLQKPFSREAFAAAVNETLACCLAPGRKPALLDTLLSIYNHRQSGLLRVGQSSPVAFIKGEPASFLARGNADFPAFLLAKGKISRDDMALFLASGAERIFFTETGILRYEELQAESQLFLMKRLMEDIAVTEEIAFVQGDGAAEPPLVQISLPHLVYDAMKFYPERFQTELFLQQNLLLYPCRTVLFYRRANLMAMRGSDIALLAMMNGQRSLQELLAAVPNRQEGAGFFHLLQLLAMIRLCAHPEAEASPDFVQKTLFNRPLEELEMPLEMSVGFEDIVEEVTENVVLAMGNSDLAAPLSQQDINFEQAVQREYALIKGKDYYVIFGMTPARFSFKALKEAYFAKMKEYSPERFMELSGTTSTMAQEILSIYADAYNTLSNVVAKERYDEMLNADKTLGIDGKQDGRLHARIQFQSGQVFLEMGEFENAEKALQEAYTLEPDNAGHAAYLAWAIYRNSANKNSKTALDRARSLLTKSLQIEKSAAAFSFRGWMLFDDGRDGLAEGDFLKALKLNPKEANARMGLKLIAEKREGEKKGIIRRFFG